MQEIHNVSLGMFAQNVWEPLDLAQGQNPASAMCAWRLYYIFSRCIRVSRSGFLPQSKGMYCTLIGISILSVAYECV